MDNEKSVTARIEELKADEFSIIEELAGVATQIHRYTERVRMLSPRLRAVRAEMRRLGLHDTMVSA